MIATVMLNIWIRKRKKSSIAPSSVSLFSGVDAPHTRPYSGYGHPQPGFELHEKVSAGSATTRLGHLGISRRVHRTSVFAGALTVPGVGSAFPRVEQHEGWGL